MQGTKVGALGGLAALMGSAQALGWIDVAPHHASEMGIPTLIGASAMMAFAVAGIALAPAAVRRDLYTPGLIASAVATVLASCGAWLLAQTG